MAEDVDDDETVADIEVLVKSLEPLLSKVLVKPLELKLGDEVESL